MSKARPKERDLKFKKMPLTKLSRKIHSKRLAENNPSEMSRIEAGNLKGNSPFLCEDISYLLADDCRVSEAPQMESTHLNHLPENVSIFTNDGELDLTEDGTLYHSAVESQAASSSSFVTAKRSPEKTSTESSTSLKPPMSAKVLFSLDKRKSMVHRRINQRPVLVQGSSDEVSESDIH